MLEELSGRGKKSQLQSTRDADERVLRNVRRDGESKNGEGFKGPGGEHVKNIRAASRVRQNSWETRTQEHVAGCRREKTSSVSIPRHPSRERLVHQEGWGVHHEQEKSVPRKEGNV